LVGPLKCNCSVIGDKKTREAMVVDPGDDIDDVLAIIAKHNLTVKQIIITHGHIDHIGGAMKLKAATGAPIAMNEADQMQVKLLPMQEAWIGVEPPGKVEIDQSLKDEDSFTGGEVGADVLQHYRIY